MEDYEKPLVNRNKDTEKKQSEIAKSKILFDR